MVQVQELNDYLTSDNGREDGSSIPVEYLPQTGMRRSPDPSILHARLSQLEKNFNASLRVIEDSISQEKVAA